MINLIVAIAKNNVIGKGNELPWHYKEDLEYFKQTTMGHTVLMGEATFRSILGYIKKPLPGRTSVIATLSGYTYKGVESTDDVLSFIQNFPNDKELFIIGGKIIYDLTLEHADRLYITHINQEHEGDVFFKDIPYDSYKIIKERTSGDLRFVVYERR